MGNRIIRLLWARIAIKNHPPELEDSPYLPPFDIPFEVYDEETGEVIQKGMLEDCYFSSITLNDDTQEYSICRPIEINDFTKDSDPWHVEKVETIGGAPDEEPS